MGLNLRVYTLQRRKLLHIMLYRILEYIFGAPTDKIDKIHESPTSVFLERCMF
jgi:hypothetical protein